MELAKLGARMEMMTGKVARSGDCGYREGCGGTEVTEFTYRGPVVRKTIKGPANNFWVDEARAAEVMSQQRARE